MDYLDNLLKFNRFGGINYKNRTMDGSMGLWERSKKLGKELDYKPLSLDDFNDFKKILIRQPVRQYVYYVGQFQLDYQEATEANDTVRLAELDLEILHNRIDNMVKISEFTELDYDIVYMLCNKYSFNKRRDRVEWSLLMDYSVEYEDRSFDFVISEGKFDIVEEVCYGWSNEEVSRKEVKDIFSELIINDFKR